MRSTTAWDKTCLVMASWESWAGVDDDGAFQGYDQHHVTPPPPPSEVSVHKHPQIKVKNQWPSTFHRLPRSSCNGERKKERKLILLEFSLFSSQRIHPRRQHLTLKTAASIGRVVCESCIRWNAARHLHGGLKKNRKTCQNSVTLCWDLNPGPVNTKQSARRSVTL
jgi:hypothetical protein